MSPAKKWLNLIGGICLSVLFGAGCGRSAPPAAAEAAEARTETEQDPKVLQTGGKTLLPRVSIGSSARVKPQKTEAADDIDDEEDLAEDREDGDDSNVVAPKQGTPEWLIHEATRIRLQPPLETEDVAKLRASRKERNEKIVSLAQQAITATHKDKKQERLMNVAVHQLMEARLQLALMGDRTDIDAIYEDAAALQARDPQSQGAAEGAYALVSFAYSHAKTSAQADPRWLQEFARQATNYASNFPKEEPRSLPLLFTAARSCELHGLMEEAAGCYSLIKTAFPKSPYARRVTGILRRLNLAGQPAQLSGPTLEGGNLAIDDLAGRVVLVVFWSTEAKPFEAQLPQLLEVHRKYSKYGLAVVGVNLDKEPTPVNQFLVANKISWPQIFFPEPEQRGWNNPVASFYGVMEIPALWLIDPEGKVVTTTLTTANLESEVRKLLRQQAAAKKAAAAEAKQ